MAQHTLTYLQKLITKYPLFYFPLCADMLPVHKFSIYYNVTSILEYLSNLIVLLWGGIIITIKGLLIIFGMSPTSMTVYSLIALGVAIVLINLCTWFGNCNHSLGWGLGLVILIYTVVLFQSAYALAFVLMMVGFMTMVWSCFRRYF